MQQSRNPILPPTAFIPDGEPRVFMYEGKPRVFLYGSRDERGDGYCGYGHDVWSAPVDALGDWICHGEAFHVRDVLAIGYGFADKQIFGAPDCVYNPVTRKYYLYTFLGGNYPLDGVHGPHKDAPGTVPGWENLGPKTVMASSDSPAGPFTNPMMCDWPPANADGAFDPAVLVDEQEDGSVRVYAYWGMGRNGNGAERCAEIDPNDMRTVINPETRLPDRTATRKTLPEKEDLNGSTIFEASSIRKVAKDCYVFIYSSNERNCALTYCYGPTPFGPWTYGGRIVDTRLGWMGRNNHGSICQIGDQWYVFYHRHTKGGFVNRQAMMEPIEVRIVDGRVEIPLVEMTSQAASVNGLEAFARYNIASCCWVKGEGMILGWPRQPDGLHPMTGIKNGTCLGFKYLQFGAVPLSVTDRVRLGLHMQVLQDTTVSILVVRREDVDAEEKRVEIGKARLVASAPAEDGYQEVEIPLDALDGSEALRAIGGLCGKLALFLGFSGDEGELCEIKEFWFAKA
jgi:arabinoxylan arabinofuranohydrolase